MKLPTTPVLYQDDGSLAVMAVLHSKGLPQSNEVLSGFDSWWRVQVVTDIDSDRSNRSGIPNAEAEGVRILPMETNPSKDVSTVVKADHSEIFLDWNWNAKLRIYDQELIATGGDRDGGAHRRVVFIADGYGTLLARAVEWESTQGAASSGKELLADRDTTVGKRFEETYSDAVRPHNLRR